MHPLVEPNGPPGDIGASTLRGAMYELCRTGRHKVCEWRPGCYATAGVLADWGTPASCCGVFRTHILRLLEPQVTEYQLGGISLLFGHASAQLEIDDASGIQSP